LHVKPQSLRRPANLRREEHIIYDSNDFMIHFSHLFG
jgi:hypothetical protein